MATDATGTPTPLGIPKYNTAGDPPSGKGFNATMDSIDSIVTTLLAAKAPLASPSLTGNPLAPTPAPGDNDTSIATTAFVAAAMAALVPSGTIVKTAASAAPSGWIMADGSVVTRGGANAALFAAIGTTYGAGDGSTTFALPNLKGRVPIHPDGGTFGAIGSTGGEATHVLLTGEMPVHTHTASFAGDVLAAHAHTYTSPDATSAIQGTSGGQFLSNAVKTITAGTATSSVSAGTPTGTVTVNNAGSGTAHNNIQPYIVINHIIKL